MIIGKMTATVQSVLRKTSDKKMESYVLGVASWNAMQELLHEKRICLNLNSSEL